MKQLVVVGEFDSNNVGDQLIGEGHEVLFADLGWDVRIASLELNRLRCSTDNVDGLEPEVSNLRRIHREYYDGSLHYRHAVDLARLLSSPRHAVQHARSTLAGADAMVIGGGQLLSDGTLRMLVRLYILALEAKRQGIPVFAFGTGISVPRTIFSKALLTAILGLLTSESCFRDAASIETARRLSKSHWVLPDVVPDCAIAAVLAKCPVPEATRRGVVGVAPMVKRDGASGGVDDDEWWQSILVQIASSGRQPRLLCSGVVADHGRCVELHENLKARGIHVEMAERPNNSEQFLKELASLESVIAHRLHISISYFATGRSPTAVIWDRKLAQFFAMVGLSERLVRSDEQSPEDTIGLLFKTAVPSTSATELVSRARRLAQRCLVACAEKVRPSASEIPVAPSTSG